MKWKHFPFYWPFVRECTGERWIPRTKSVTRSFDIFVDLRLNKRETPSHSKRRNCNDVVWSTRSHTKSLIVRKTVNIIYKLLSTWMKLSKVIHHRVVFRYALNLRTADDMLYIFALCVKPLRSYNGNFSISKWTHVPFSREPFYVR